MTTKRESSEKSTSRRKIKAQHQNSIGNSDTMRGIQESIISQNLEHQMQDDFLNGLKKKMSNRMDLALEKLDGLRSANQKAMESFKELNIDRELDIEDDDD